MKNKKWLIPALALSLTACHLPAAGEQARLTCVIPDKQDTVFWSDIEQGVRGEAAAREARLSVIYTETNSGAASIDLNDAIHIARLSSTDALILSYSNADEETDRELAEARQTGIKVVLVDSDADEALRDGYVGIDNEEAGYQIAGYALSQIDETKEVFVPVMPSYSDKANFVERLNGIRRAFADCPERLSEYTLSEDLEIQRAAEIRSQLLQRENVGAVICCSERMSILGTQILENLGSSGEPDQREILLYGFDRSEETEELLRRGRLRALVSQNNVDLGAESVRTAMALLGVSSAGEAEPQSTAGEESPEGIHLVPFELLTAEDMAEEEE